MSEDMKPTTPETVTPQWTEHLPVQPERDYGISKELDQAIQDELKAKPKDIVVAEVKEDVNGKSPL